MAVSGDFCLNDKLKTTPGDCGCGVLEGTCTDEISFRQALTTIPSIKNIPFDLDYTVTEKRDLVLVLLDGNGGWVGNKIVTVEPGSGTERMVLTFTNAPTVGPSYRLDAYIRPVGGDFSTNIISTTVNVTVVASGTKDCAGVVDGIAQMDGCGICSGGNTGVTPQSENCNTEEEMIDFITTYTTLETATSFDIEVSYVTSQQRDVVVLLNAADGTWLGNAVETVDAGSGTITLTINLAEAPTPGVDYKLGAAVREVGTGWAGNIDYKSQLVELKGTITGVNGVFDELSVYPNPTNGIVHLSKLSEWRLYNLNGVMLDYGTGTTISLVNQNKGVYWVSIGGRRYKIVNQ